VNPKRLLLRLLYGQNYIFTYFGSVCHGTQVLQYPIVPLLSSRKQCPFKEVGWDWSSSGVEDEMEDSVGSPPPKGGEINGSLWMVALLMNKLLLLLLLLLLSSSLILIPWWRSSSSESGYGGGLLRGGGSSSSCCCSLVIVTATLVASFAAFPLISKTRRIWSRRRQNSNC